MMDQYEDEAERHPFDPPAEADREHEIHEGAAPKLALDDDDRLPWLESADDDDDDEGAIDTGRVLRFLVFGLVLLAAIGGALWFVKHRAATAPTVAEGGVIKAPAEPYKAVPANQGGKTYAGTGDSAFAASEGKTTQARVGRRRRPGRGLHLASRRRSGVDPPLWQQRSPESRETPCRARLGRYRHGLPPPGRRPGCRRR